MESHLESFYAQVAKDTNATFASDVMSKFVQLFPEQKEALESPLNEINFDQIVNSVNQQQLLSLLTWKNPQASNKTKAKASIQRLTPDKGDLFGLGNQFKGTMVLSGFKSKWASHQFQFTEDKKSVLNDQFETIMAEKENMEFRDFQKMLQLQLQFDLGSETKEFQDKSCLDQIKALELLKHLVSKSAVSASGIPLVSGSEIKYNGFIQNKYDQYHQEDVKKMSCVLNIKQTNSKFNDAVEIVQYVPKDDGYELVDASEQCNTIFDYINLIKNKKMDFVVCLNSCSLKKEGRNVIAMPKLQILQIILRDSIQKQSTNIGLNLNKKR